VIRILSSRAAALVIGLAAWLALAGCAGTVVEATGPIDWAAVADERVPEILTVDPDGDLRETKLWIAVLDGQGFIRTSNTRWFRNIERDPDVTLRIAGAAYSLRAEPVIDGPLRDRIHAAFREKYGFQDRLVGLGGNPADANILRLVPRTE
jgi:hypothetical protein